jgi:anaerobic selenocysteine-containing dehydrogenase
MPVAAGYDSRGFFGVNWSALYRDDLRRSGTCSLSMTRLGEGLLYTAPYEAAQRHTPLAERYPLALIAGADHYFLNSVFANMADQMKRSGPPVVRIHPADAAMRRLRTGHETCVFNDRGAFVARVEITDRVRQGVVASTKGRWPRFAPGGTTVNATVNERDSDMGGGAVFHDNRVEIERLS